jgi:hypothetical protein
MEVIELIIFLTIRRTRIKHISHVQGDLLYTKGNGQIQAIYFNNKPKKYQTFQPGIKYQSDWRIDLKAKI